MPQFSYKARKRSGELVEGVLEVADRAAALVQIQRSGLFPIAVDSAKAGAVLDGKPAAKARSTSSGSGLLTAARAERITAQSGSNGLRA